MEKKPQLNINKIINILPYFTFRDNPGENKKEIYNQIKVN